MISELVPQFRQLRNRLVVGSLWLLVAWLAWGRQLPDQAQATGLLADAYRLGDQLGHGVVLTGAGGLAWLVGACLMGLAPLLRGGVTRMARRVPGRVGRWLNSPATATWSHLAAQADLFGPGLAPDADPSDARAAAYAELQDAADSDIAAAPYRWPVQAADLWRVMDRTREEYELFEGVALPMATFAILWAWISGPSLSQTSPVVWVLLLLAFWCAVQSRRRHVVIHRLVFEAVLTGRIKGELFKVLQEWQEKTGLTLPYTDEVTEPAPQSNALSATLPPPRDHTDTGQSQMPMRR